MCKKFLRACFLVVLLHSVLIPIASGMPQLPSSKRTKIIDLRMKIVNPAISGEIHKGQTHRYVLRAKAGQIIEILLKAETRPTVSLYAQDGSVIPENSDRFYELPRSGDYVLVVRPNDEPGIASRGRGHYMMFIWKRSRD